MKEFIASLIPYATLLAQVLFIAGISLLSQTKVRLWVKKHAWHIVFVFSLCATLGSLFYSEVMLYNPCKLCWFQRILMYPLVIISGFSLRKHTLQTVRIVLVLASLGLLVSAYQYILQLVDASTTCGVGVEDCTSRIVFTFGFISIPLMAMTAFAIIIVAMMQLTRKR